MNFIVYNICIQLDETATYDISITSMYSINYHVKHQISTNNLIPIFAIDSGLFIKNI